jgi:RNA methyltransferase, TrmH family
LITLKKLVTLPLHTRYRKFTRLFHEVSLQALAGIEPDRNYLGGLCELICQDSIAIIGNVELQQACSKLKMDMSTIELTSLAWRCSDISHLLLTLLGKDQSDWDFFDRDSGILDPSHRTVLPHTVVVDRIRSPFNLGSLFRTADSFGVDSMLLVSPATSPNHPRSIRTARGCIDTVPWEELPLAQIQERIRLRPVFALELGGQDLDAFEFPRDAVVVVGSEELGVSPELLAIADSSLGRVSIPLAGSKGSLNVSVAFGIIMQAWFSYSLR